MAIKKRFKNKKALFAIGALVVLVAIGGVIAANRTIFPFDNKFVASIFQTEVSETFDSPEDWKPCDETQKLVKVKNTGDIDAVARIKMDEQWISRDEQELGLIYNGVTLAQVTFANSDWELREGYYYYKNTLHPGESSDFISAVSFNCEADFGENEMIDGNGNVVDSTTNDYNGASYHLNITAQLMDASIEDSWEEVFDGYKEPKTFAMISETEYFSTYLNNVKYGRSLNAFRRSKVMPDASTLSSDAKLTEIQAAGETPIYMWYVPEETAMYWYSTADAITLGPTKNSLGGLFCGMLFSEKAVDVSGFKYLDTKNLGSLQSVFCGDYIPDDLSDISHWDLSGVTTWGGVFNSRGSSGYYFKQEHMNGLKHWKVPKNVSLSGAFTGNSNITSLEALSEWDTSEVVDHSGELTGLSNLTTTKGLDHIVGAGATSISSMFAGDGNIRDLDGLKKWDVSNVTNMYQVFPTVKATNLDALRNWKVSKVTNFGGMFTAMSELLDVSGIGGWNVSSGTNFSSMFGGDSKATGFGALGGWNVANGTDFSWMFSGTGIEDGRPFENWAVSPSATIEKMFYGAPNLTEDEYPSWYTADRRGED